MIAVYNPIHCYWYLAELSSKKMFKTLGYRVSTRKDIIAIATSAEHHKL